MRRQKLDSLTGLRGIAALMVAVMHSLEMWPHFSLTGTLTQLGGLAVPFFFCLSGFVMQWTWSQRPIRPFSFLVRRFARIYPTAILGLLLAIIAYRILGSPLAGYIGSRHSVLLSFLLLQSWAYDVPTIRQSWDGVSWSLSCEFFFYVASPVLLPLINRVKFKGALILLVALVIGYFAMRVYGAKNWGEDFLVFAPIARLPEYVCGALLARVIVGAPMATAKWVPPLVFFIFVALPITIAHVHFTASFSMLDAVALPGFVILILASAYADLDLRGTKSIFTIRPLMFLGKISFSFYMIHALVLGLMSSVSKHVTVGPMSELEGEIWRIAFLIAATCAASVVCIFFEDPINNFVLRWAAKRLKCDTVETRRGSVM